MPKIYFFCGNTAHLHESVFRSQNNRQHCRVWRKQNESCYVDSNDCKLASKCASLGICTAAEAYIFFVHVSRHDITLIVLGHYKNVKEYPLGIARKLARYKCQREHLEYNAERDW